MNSFLTSSVGRKYVMAVTGIFLFGFVVVHMLGNLQIYLGQDALNDYAKHLEELPYLLWPARIFLLITLVIHIFVAFSLAIENRAARPVRYAKQGTVQASYASRTMVMSGVIIFLFIVYHLLHFTWGKIQPQFFEQLDAKGREDLYGMVVHGFGNVYISAFYIFAMGVLCFHLSHGLESLFQSLGLRSKSMEPLLRKIAITLALFVFIGNCSIPVSVLLGFIKMPGGG